VICGSKYRERWRKKYCYLCEPRIQKAVAVSLVVGLKVFWRPWRFASRSAPAPWIRCRGLWRKESTSLWRRADLEQPQIRHLPIKWVVFEIVKSYVKYDFGSGAGRSPSLAWASPVLWIRHFTNTKHLSFGLTKGLLFDAAKISSDAFGKISGLSWGPEVSVVAGGSAEVSRGAVSAAGERCRIACLLSKQQCVVVVAEIS